MGFTRITEEDMKNKGVSGLPDTPNLSVSDMQAKFDELSVEVIAPKVNTLAEELESESASANLGIVPPEGFTGNTVQKMVDEIAESIKEVVEKVNDHEDSIVTDEKTIEEHSLQLEEYGEAITENARKIEENAQKIDAINTMGVPTFDNSASGESIQLIDSTDNKVTAFALHGNVTQKQYTGKNLLENTGTNQTICGVTFTVNEDGSVTLDGTSTAGFYNYYVNADMSDLPNGTYMVTFEGPAGRSIWLTPIMSDGTKVYNGTTDVQTITITDDLKIDSVRIWVNTGQTFSKDTYYPMIRLSTVTDNTYEPYVGGIHSPNPDYPQEIEIAGASGSINVSTENEDSSLATSANISTPSGLMKIIGGHGNCTEENGTAYTTDEIIKYADGTGKKIQRIVKLILDGTEEWGLQTTNTFVFNSEQLLPKISYVVCDSYVATANSASTMPDKTIKQNFFNGRTYGFIMLKDTTYATVDELKAGLSAKNVVCYAVLKEPVITDLSAEEIAEIEKLQTFYPTTNISNDAGCVMEVVYKADVKNHIDNIILGRVATLEAALLNNI